MIRQGQCEISLERDYVRQEKENIGIGIKAPPPRAQGHEIEPQ